MPTESPGSPQPMIHFENVTKAFGELVVLRELNFDVRAGEKVTVIGPSGSGKTTILRILMTLETPTQGVVRVDGKELWNVAAGARARETAQLRGTRKNIGMVFQQFNLFPHMTALENVIEAPVAVLRTPKEQARAEGMELLRQVGLEQHAGKRPAMLSGGQQQRVAIARAMAMKPKVMLFDEPTSALDPELIGEVLRVIHDLASNTDMTMLLVTHEMHFAEQISDRVVMFDEGVAIEQGPPQQIFNEPRHERTQRFLSKVLSQRGDHI
ncbi:amino acid ABC transporter ATP-binding protein (PAAT family) [Propionibacteriaceae bacterium ES.041]|uniref:amino acid ABC transporter ATP-binding protein n=1 Tax=Enemella evansiae TaxID=2016499 RepID=UPI000C000EFE|nr:amino acid ABC transporter ATP-binding protein [Enemella evansiae]PFG66428.1 amino acid ABC transporter ATP-binding protein (PAAT family) [Propionibacteriaceae bacterium ES.041]